MKALIKEDLAKHPGAKISEISSRIPDIVIKEIRNMVYSMVDEDIYSEGAKTNRIYYLNSGRTEKETEKEKSQPRSQRRFASPRNTTSSRSMICS